MTVGAGAFGLGYRALRALIESKSLKEWNRHRMVPEMFKPGEDKAYEWVRSFVQKHHALPSLHIAAQNFPDLGMVPVPDPASYYVEHLENRLYYEVINEANVLSQSILKANQSDSPKAEQVMHDCLARLKKYRYRAKIVNFPKEGPKMVMQAYHAAFNHETAGLFGWEYMDKWGGVQPGDFCAYIGRPAAGKTWLIIYGALMNWLAGKRVLVVSMEMAPLPISQRLVAVYAKHSISQIKSGGISSMALPGFVQSMQQLQNSENDGFYIVDGNLAADPEDIYLLADQFDVDMVFIDGAYLCRNKNTKLDRFTRVAENTEAMKRYSQDTLKPTFASYQFARSAVKKKADKGTAGLDDIGYSDVVGQIASVAMALDQEDSVETINSRIIRLIKGRNGELGEFRINWDFMGMDFSQINEEASPEAQHAELTDL